MLRPVQLCFGDHLISKANTPACSELDKNLKTRAHPFTEKFTHFYTLEVINYISLTQIYYHKFASVPLYKVLIAKISAVHLSFKRGCKEAWQTVLGSRLVKGLEHVWQAASTVAPAVKNFTLKVSFSPRKNPTAFMTTKLLI